MRRPEYSPMLMDLIIKIKPLPLLSLFLLFVVTQFFFRDYPLLGKQSAGAWGWVIFAARTALGAAYLFSLLFCETFLREPLHRFDKYTVFFLFAVIFILTTASALFSAVALVR